MKEIMENFNKLAEKLGCKARVKGRKNIEFYECIGIDSKGYEIIVKVRSDRFAVLVNKYPQLCE